MSIDEDTKEEQEQQEWTNSFLGYQYKTIVPGEKKSGPILAIKIETHIHKEKLDIIEKIIRDTEQVQELFESILTKH